MGYVVWVVKGEPMSSVKTVQSIYTCLEMLRLSNKPTIVDYWVKMLYDNDGNPLYSMWNERTLIIMENDVIYNVEMDYL